MLNLHTHAHQFLQKYQIVHGLVFEEVHNIPLILTVFQARLKFTSKISTRSRHQDQGSLITL